MPEELKLAIGLIWGHLNVRQFEEAYILARGCRDIWPEENLIKLMLAYATVEIGEPLDAATLAVLEQENCEEWRALILRRAENYNVDDGDGDD